jgi:RNA polymerase-binding transcription factor DksA
MFSQEILTDRLAHLTRKCNIKKASIRDPNTPAEIADLRNKTFLKIVMAMEKIHSRPEEYGICEKCGEAIPLLRLKSIPEARFCINCQKMEDRHVQFVNRLTDQMAT